MIKDTSTTSRFESISTATLKKFTSSKQIKKTIWKITVVMTCKPKNGSSTSLILTFEVF